MLVMKKNVYTFQNLDSLYGSAWKHVHHADLCVEQLFFLHNRLKQLLKEISLSL